MGVYNNSNDTVAIVIFCKKTGIVFCIIPNPHKLIQRFIPKSHIFRHGNIPFPQNVWDGLLPSFRIDLQEILGMN
jgi:hypothetical protein